MAERNLKKSELVQRSIIKKFRKNIWSNFVGAVQEYELIKAGDKIAVCISGGKDSVLMACCLRQLQKHSEVPFELVYLVMDPGYAPKNRELIEYNAKLLDLDVEIFQAGHQGSDTGTSKDFLNEMSPECIVISCGMQNKYDHPVKSVVDLFKELDLPVYRTDESGDIIMTTDGTEYIFNVEPGTYTSGKEYNDQKGK